MFIIFGIFEHHVSSTGYLKLQIEVVYTGCTGPNNIMKNYNYPLVWNLPNKLNEESLFSVANLRLLSSLST